MHVACTCVYYTRKMSSLVFATASSSLASLRKLREGVIMPSCELRMLARLDKQEVCMIVCRGST